MGLPRSSLVKSSSSGAAAGAPLAPLAPLAGHALPAPPTPASLPVPVPAPAASPVATFAPAVNPFAVRASGPDIFAPSSAPAPFAAVPLEDGLAREAFRTKADSVEVEMVESQRAPEPARDVMRGSYASAPSASELLARAAALGPARMTWESIVLPNDPILNEKLQPHVRERRARLTRVVKIALGACVGLCVLALGASAVSGDASPPAANASTSMGKTVASKGIVPIERLDGTKHVKAVRRAAPAATTAAIVRGGKRR